MPGDLGPLLKSLRAEAGLTQEELAEKAEVSARTISDAERGIRTRIYRDTADRLADALGLDDARRPVFLSSARGRPAEPTRDASSPPTPPTRLIGRDRELHLVLETLARPDVRLLTITGPGGIGKTRLALEAAPRSRFERTVFVQLATARDVAAVMPEIARAVGVSGALEPTVETIAEHLGPSRTLLFLDTMEHVLPVASQVAELLALAPMLTVLATSREALHIRAEHEVALPALESPIEPTAASVMEAPASALFIERALAVRSDLTIDERSAEAIVEICRRVEGIPLAIELAAARTKHMPVQALCDQLENRLSVLVSGPRDLPQRQQTMRGTIVWSYDLLSTPERSLLADLSVFAGGWTLDAAAAVSRTDVLPSMSALVDKSLVTMHGADVPRYGMLDMVREFASELRAGDRAQTRHLAYFLGLAEEAEPELGRSDQHAWMGKLAVEHDNMRAAMDYTVATSDGQRALRLGGAIWRFWLLAGHLTEGRRRLREALAAGDGSTWRAKGLWGLAWLAYHQGDYAEAMRCGEEMLSLAGQDPTELRNALTITAIVDIADGRYADAVAKLDRCVSLVRERDDWLLATSLLNLGMGSSLAGDPRASDILTEARECYVQLGDRHYEARTLVYSGHDELRRHAVDAAVTLFRESLLMFWELEDLWGITEAIEGFAAAAGAAADVERAGLLCGAAEALRERINTMQFAADRRHMEDMLNGVRAAAGVEGWRSLFERGRALALDDAVAYALG